MINNTHRERLYIYIYHIFDVVSNIDCIYTYIYVYSYIIYKIFYNIYNEYIGYRYIYIYVLCIIYIM